MRFIIAKAIQLYITHVHIIVVQLISVTVVNKQKKISYYVVNVVMFIAMIRIVNQQKIFDKSLSFLKADLY